MKTAYQLYMAEIENIPSMSKAEELMHFRLWKERGKKSARLAIYKANLRFVVKVAHKYKNQGVAVIDLISEGNCALDTAMEKFNHNSGNKFISYAVWHIRQAMLSLLAMQSRFISITGTEAVQKANLDKAANKLAQELNREPTEHEIADKVGCAVERVRHMEMMLENNVVASLDVEVDKGGRLTMTLQDVISDKNANPPDDINDTTTTILKFLKDAELSEQQIAVLTSVYGINRNARSLEEIRFDYNHSRERMRQVKDEALKKLQAFTRKAKVFNIPNLLEEVR